MKMESIDVVPVEIENTGDKGIRIRWQDGHEAIYPHTYLREGCQCASCIEEWSGKKLISAGQIPDNIAPTQIKAVGRYAVSIHWSDGHNTGIYPFDYVRKICPCPDCKPSEA